MATTVNLYRAICAKRRSGLFSRNVVRSRSKRFTCDKSDFWRYWSRWNFSFTSGENKIPDSLFRGWPIDGVLTKIRNEISQNKPTTRANTDTRLGSNVFFKVNFNQQLRAASFGGLLKLSLAFLLFLRVYRD